MYHPPVRIIAGEYRSRKLWTPEGLSTRPMPDRVRESIFGMLGLRVKNAAVVDLFAGSGSIGLEALSRGAASCLLVDRDKLAAGAIERNIETLRCADRAHLVTGDALGMSILARCPRPIDLVFLDPPYPLVEDAGGWARVKAQCAELVRLLADDGFLIIRTPNPFLVNLDPAADPDAPSPPAPRPETPRFARKRKYQRERRRWEDEPSAPNRGPMRRGSAVPPPQPARPRPLHQSPHDDPDADDDLDDAELIGGLLAGEQDQPDAPHLAPPGADNRAGVRVAPSAGPLAAQPQPPRQPADLAIPGAIGPETHQYGSTAVHWYQRARHAPDGPQSDDAAPPRTPSGGDA